MSLNNKETDISVVQSINIEKSEKVSKYAKTEMLDNTEQNNESVQEADAKFIIKIPKPFALGYITIDLSKLLRGLLKGLSAAVIALVLSKISNLLLDKLLTKIENNNLTEDDLNDAVNDLDINSIINESENEINNQLQEDSVVDVNVGDVDNKVKDKYTTPNKNKRNISNKSKYTIDKRNRKSILDSDVVDRRNGSSNRNVRIVKNPNYGNYID